MANPAGNGTHLPALLEPATLKINAWSDLSADRHAARNRKAPQCRLDRRWRKRPTSRTP